MGKSFDKDYALASVLVRMIVTRLWPIRLLTGGQ
jgi:hypothetical protein